MKLKKRRFIGGFNRFRLMLTLGLAVLLPAAALIFINFISLRHFERNKILEAAIHRDFQEMLAITEKKINKRAYTIAEEARDLFPSPDSDQQEKEKRLDLILAKSPWLSHALLFDEKGIVLRSQPQQMADKYFSTECEQMVEGYRAWFNIEGKSLVESISKSSRHIMFWPEQTKRAEGPAYLTTALFIWPQLSSDRVVLGGVTFDPYYLKQTFFPEMLPWMWKVVTRTNHSLLRQVGVRAIPKSHGKWTMFSVVSSLASSSRARAWRHSARPGFVAVSGSWESSRC